MGKPVSRFYAASLLFCVVAAMATPENIAPLTDEDVAVILDREPAGLFYAWSPHMPLSVDGLHEVLAAGERLDITIIPVLSSHANTNYARDRIAGRGLPDEVLRKSLSARLIEQNLFIHAPAILIFAEGKFSSPVIPGFRYADDYQALIDRFLAAARQKNR